MGKEASEDRGRRFAFNANTRNIESISAGPAIGMAFCESAGICDIIDSNTRWDRSQRVLSPGMAAKAVLATMYTHNNKRALRNIRGFHNYGPVDVTFSAYADHDSFNDVTIGRGVDTMYSADLETLYYTVASRVKAQFGIVSRHLNLDQSDIEITRDPNSEYIDLPEDMPRPMLGKSKKGHLDRLKYNFCGGVDDNGFLMYFRTYSGNVTDNRMDAAALRFLEDVLTDERIVATADCKVVTREMVDSFIWNNIPFVSKCPENFGECVKQRVIDDAIAKGFVPIGRIGNRKNDPCIEVCDFSETANGDVLRFVAYREVGVKHSLEYYRTQVAKEVDRIIGASMKKRFACDDDVRLEYERILKKVGDRPYVLSMSSSCTMVPKSKRGRGRPKKDAVLEMKEERRISVTKGFSETDALKLAEWRDIRVIVTSLPRLDPSQYSESPSDTDREPIDGATAADVVKVYRGQWRIERCFRDMKTDLGADEVFFESPKREATMPFLIALAVMTRNLMQNLLRKAAKEGMRIPADIPASAALESIQNVTVRFDRSAGEVYLDGPNDETARVISYCKALGIEPSQLIR